MGEVGDRLRRAREAKGLTLDQMEEITKIRRRYLQALEDEDYGQLPGEVFVRGFLRNYALALELDAEEILIASGHKAPAPILPASEVQELLLNEPLTPPRGRQRLIAGVIGLMAVAALALGGWWFYRYLGPGSNGSPTPIAQISVTPIQALQQNTLEPTPTQMASPSPLATETAEATPTPMVGVLLRIAATQKAWIRVTADGRLAYEGTLEAGQTREWSAGSEIVLLCGNAGGVTVWYNGQEQEPIGTPGQVVEHTWKAGPLPESIDESLPTAEGTPGALSTPPREGTPSRTATHQPTRVATEAPSATKPSPATETSPGTAATPPAQETPTPTP